MAGDVVGISRPSERLAAASENVMLAPHWWQRVAPAPTSVPQAGQSFGRGCSLSPPNIPLNFFAEAVDLPTQTRRQGQ